MASPLPMGQMGDQKKYKIHKEIKRTTTQSRLKFKCNKIQMHSQNKIVD